MKKNGFTMIELVLVISILGILAVSALPSFVNLTGNARIAARDGIIGAIRSGISIKHIKDLADDPSKLGYPDPLDNTSVNTTCDEAGKPCFEQILNQVITDPDWKKGADSKNYSYNGKDAKINCVYNPSDNKGTFICTPP